MQMEHIITITIIIMTPRHQQKPKFTPNSFPRTKLPPPNSPSQRRKRMKKKTEKRKRKVEKRRRKMKKRKIR